MYDFFEYLLAEAQKAEYEELKEFNAQLSPSEKTLVREFQKSLCPYGIPESASAKRTINLMTCAYIKGYRDAHLQTKTKNETADMG